MTARVIGIGQPLAGDDGAGIAVVRLLESRGALPGIELHEVAEPSALVPLLEGVDRIVLVDAVLAPGDPGRVLRLVPDEVRARGVPLLSTHGVGVMTAIDLARSTCASVATSVEIVGITIDRATRHRHELSPEVARAVPLAAAMVGDLLGARHAAWRRES